MTNEQEQQSPVPQRAADKIVAGLQEALVIAPYVAEIESLKAEVRAMNLMYKEAAEERDKAKQLCFRLQDTNSALALQLSRARGEA